MLEADVAEVKARQSYYLRLAKAGEDVVICECNRPVAHLVAIKPQIDRALLESAIGMFEGGMTDPNLMKPFDR
ncbi:MAG: hypothetical protein P4L46_09505 [Fimbriimonas sp.]|nr:hypothetical protein [Fimbriimonas sp.]